MMTGSAHILTHEEVKNSFAHGLLAYHHIKKCAGSTVRAILQERYGETFFRLESGEDALRVRAALEEGGADAVQCVAGDVWGVHAMSAGVPVAYAALLRNPVRQTLSQFTFLTKRFLNAASLHDFVLNMNSNVMTRILGGGDLERAKKRLAGYAFVGLVEQFDASIAAMGALFGLETGSYVSRNVSQVQPPRVDPELHGLIEEQNNLDMELYAFAEELFASRDGTTPSPASVSSQGRVLVHTSGKAQKMLGKGAVGEAIKHWRKKEKDFIHSDHLALAEMYLREGRLEDVSIQCRKAMEKKPGASDVVYRMAPYMWNIEPQWIESLLLENVKQCRELGVADGTSATGIALQCALSLLGNGYYDQGRFVEADNAYAEMVAIDPDNWDIVSVASMYFRKRGQRGRALELVRAYAEKQERGSPLVAYHLAVSAHEAGDEDAMARATAMYKPSGTKAVQVEQQALGASFVRRPLRDICAGEGVVLVVRSAPLVTFDDVVTQLAGTTCGRQLDVLVPERGEGLSAGRERQAFSFGFAGMGTPEWRRTMEQTLRGQRYAAVVLPLGRSTLQSIRPYLELAWSIAPAGIFLYTFATALAPEPDKFCFHYVGTEEPWKK